MIKINYNYLKDIFVDFSIFFQNIYKNKGLKLNYNSLYV